MSVDEKIITIEKMQSVKDYTQSANTLFHFMSKEEFLKNSIDRKALVPRFCLEDISYLEIWREGIQYKEIAILQKCFCDIPLHKIVENYELILSKESKKIVKENNILNLSKNNNHPSYYGEFAIAFSKEWCEKKNLQPIHYLNENSSFTKQFKTILNSAINESELLEKYVDDIINRLSMIKPLRGWMKRHVENDISHYDIKVLKNFHDEQEWRYIPDLEMIDKINKKNKVTISLIEANPEILQSTIFSENFTIRESKLIEDRNYKDIWLGFEYSDIRYFIVPDNYSRLNVINHILSLPNDCFSKNLEIQEKSVLISKILILDEIRKDW